MRSPDGPHRQRSQRAGVVHQQVQAAEPLDLGDQRGAVVGVGDVARHDPDAGEVDAGEGVRGAAVGDDSDAAGGQRAGQRQAETGGAAGDECGVHGVFVVISW